METAAFFVLAALAVMSAIVVITHRNPIQSALALAVNLVSIAGFFMLLSAQFIAIVQVIVYAGAIMVLILFVIMLLNLREETRLPHPSGRFQRYLAPVFSLLFVGVLARVYSTLGAAEFPKVSPRYGTAGAVGLEIFQRYIWPFEVVSLLLVVSMVGAVLLAKRRL